MIAPTRELVAKLNRRAREHRLDQSPTSSEVRLADGNQASVGDVIITRANDRRLRLTATDWVKNGDRWTISHVAKQGDLTVRHTRSQLTVRLPTEYVRESTGLGYATTIHAAQGVSADTMHGLLTGQESRQQLYTMLTRGRHANHLYLQVVGDGDPHTVIRPDTISPRTPTETLQQILTPSLVKSRCGGPPTASTPTTHYQPEQHSCKQPRPSGNTISTGVSPATTSAGMESERATVLDPREITGQKIDSACPNHPRSARARRRPPPAFRR